MREATQGPLKEQADKTREANSGIIEACVRPFYKEDFVITGMAVEVAMTLPLDIQCYLSNDTKAAIEVVATQLCLPAPR